MEVNPNLSGPSTPATSIIGFLDVDSFECQLYQRDFPEHRGKACVVVNKGGRVVAASYEAKQLGISRNHTPYYRDIKRKFANVPIKVFEKENRWGKQDSIKTRHATWQLLDCVKDYCKRYGNDIQIELVASDELYLDISPIVTEFIRKTQSLKVSGIRNSDRVIWERKEGPKKGPFDFDFTFNKTSLDFEDKCHLYYEMKEHERLILGAKFMDSLIQHIFQETQLQCSGGVAANKLLAKVGCGVNKPSKITILEKEGFQRLSRTLKMSDIPGLGGTAGEKLKSQLGCDTVLDLKKLSMYKLKNVLDEDLSQRFFNFARGTDNSPVVNRVMKPIIRCNKPTQDICNFYNLKLALSNLTNEMTFVLQEEELRHKRKPTEIKMDMTINTQGKAGEEKITFSGTEVSSLNNLMMDKIRSLEERKPQKVRVTELGIIARNFVPHLGEIPDSTPDVDLTGQRLTKIHISKSPNPQITNELRVKVRTTSVAVPTFSNRVRLGEFRINGKSYSTTDVNWPLLRPLEDIRKYVGRDLGEGFELKDLIKDHTEYYEFKHKSFIRFLEEKNIFQVMKKKPTFVGFNGRFHDMLQTYCLNIHGAWSFYAVNVNNMIWIWDEKLPKKSDIFSYFGANFERIATRSRENKSLENNIDEADMVYHVDQVDLGRHTLLIVNQVDAVKENGEMIEITQLSRCITFTKALRLWSQLTLQGVEKVLVGLRNEESTIGTRSEKEILSSVNEKDIKELMSIVQEQNIEQCLNFQTRLLDFVQSHLTESNHKKVKRFSWLPGNSKITSEDIPERNINTLVFHRLYSDFLKF